MIKKLKFDHWVEVQYTELEPGDYVIAGGKCFVLREPPVIDTKTGDLILIPVKPDDMPTMQIMFAGVGDYTTMAMDCVQCDLITFVDGTAIIADVDSDNQNIFTPRLTRPELEAFCEKNIDHYINFFDQNAESIEAGRHVTFTRFW